MGALRLLRFAAVDADGAMIERDDARKRREERRPEKRQGCAPTRGSAPAQSTYWSGGTLKSTGSSTAVAWFGQ
jgi:hypothetical protein